MTAIQESTVRATGLRRICWVGLAGLLGLTGCWAVALRDPMLQAPAVSARACSDGVCAPTPLEAIGTELFPVPNSPEPFRVPVNGEHQSVPGLPPDPVPKLQPQEGGPNQSLPINLPTAFRLANVNPLDIQLALQRLEAAQADLDRAEVLWLPTAIFGADYFRHDGRIQDVAGHLFDTSKQSLMVGAGPGIAFAVTDAIYAPLVARQIVQARQEEVQMVKNNVLLAVAEAYFSVQQARGEVLGLAETLQLTETLAKRVDKLAGEGMVPALERDRVFTERTRRAQASESAYERWRLASAELVRLLRLEPTTVVTPLEPPHLRVRLLQEGRKVEEWIALALANRPELAAQQHLLAAALTQVRQEQLRPWIPSVIVRGGATTPGGTLAAGYFGGGTNDELGSFGWRNTVDLQLLWQFESLGLGNDALVRRRQAEHQAAVLEFMRLRDRVTAEVVQAHAQLQSASRRVALAEDELKHAWNTVQTSLEAILQTRSVGGVPVLVVRPQEVVAGLQQLEIAYRDYYAAVADYNRAQFRLYHALGQPASLLERTPAGNSAEGAATSFGM